MKTRTLFPVVFALAVCLLLFLPGASFAQEAAATDTGGGGIGAAAIGGIVVAGIGMLVGIAAGIWLLVIAFMVHWGWGLACLFVPFAPLVFMIMNWSDAWKAFATYMGGLILMFAGGALLMTAAPTMMQQFAESGSMEDLAAQLEAEAAAMGAPPPQYPTGSESALSQTSQDEEPIAQDPPQEEVEHPPITKSSIKVGDSIARVRSAIGRPTGQIQSGEDTIMMYGAMTITARDGLVIDVTGAPSSSDEPREANDSNKKASKKQSPKKSSPKANTASGNNAKAVVTIKNGGKRVDMKTLLVPGKVTVVDFYADWCGPCVQMAPHLESLAKNDPDVVLRKVDIVNWTSDVAKQYQLRSIPNVRVFNRTGKQIGGSTSSLGQINSYISKAK